MKKNYGLLIMLFFRVFTYGQVILNIPDVNFKNALLNNDPVIDTNGDGEIQNGEAFVFGGPLFLDNKGIVDMTGIEAFNNVRIIRASSNQIETIDLSKHTSLQELYLSNNKLRQLDLSKNSRLLRLEVASNNLVSLDLSSNANMRNVNVSSNTIKILDFSNSPFMERFIANGNDLRFINAQNGSNTGLTDFVVSNNPNLSCIMIDNVVSFIVPLTWEKDATASYSENCVAPIVNIPDAAFKGILLNHSPAIDTNSDGEIQISEAEAVSNINTSRNGDIEDLTGIEYFVNLRTLDCRASALKTLDVSKNVNLTTLYCSSGEITSLNISKNTELEDLRCGDNFIKSLNISKNPKLEILLADKNDMETFFVSDIENTVLHTLHVQENKLRILNEAKFPALVSFRCEQNLITSLDISNNPNIRTFYAFSNALTSLNLKNGANTLFSPLLTNNPDLYCIKVDDVDYSNTNWNGLSNKDDQAVYNETCSTRGILIPDDNFKEALLNYIPVIDINQDGQIQSFEATAFTGTMNVVNKDIADLTGIEHFTNITNLFCNNNSLTALDVSQNTKLTTLHCGFNDLSALDISKNTELIDLFFSFNKIKTINIASNTKLQTLIGFNAELETLVSARDNYPSLTRLFLANNKLSTLITSPFSNLQILTCQDNEISALDFSLNTKITEILVQNNQLTSVDLKNGNNGIFKSLDSDFSGNSDLECIQVDDLDFSNNRWIGLKRDSGVQFSEDCGANLSVNEFELTANTNIFPVPVIDRLTINSIYDIVAVEVLNLAGNTVLLSNENTESIDMQDLPSGLYLLKITYNEGVVYKKIIKN
ncbi:T9SS type A sorting domain-containing protein [Aquimarina agarilytica]|uniref:T9SS type A sorting domain-containing protein n=1 Tax=Aquimarina agarilytica TaxID=1087449 RepID=UPI0002887FE2|nr:T9SS type A sorting domain-containing protein [Aquimarina agarilytica]